MISETKHCFLGRARFWLHPLLRDAACAHIDAVKSHALSFFYFIFLSLPHSFQVYNEKHSSLTHTHKHTQDVDLEISYLFMPNLCYHPSIYPWIYIDLCWFLVFKKRKRAVYNLSFSSCFPHIFYLLSVLFFTRWMLFFCAAFFLSLPPLYSSLVNGCYFMWDVRAGKPIECSVYIKKPLFSWLHKRNQALLVSNRPFFFVQLLSDSPNVQWVKISFFFFHQKSLTLFLEHISGTHLEFLYKNV